MGTEVHTKKFSGHPTRGLVGPGISEGEEGGREIVIADWQLKEKRSRVSGGD